MLNIWIRNIIVTLVLISIFDQLLCDTAYQKYIHVCEGMIIIVVLMSPVINIMGTDDNVVRFMDIDSLVEKFEEIGCQDELCMVAEDGKTMLLKNYKMQLEKQLVDMFEGEAVSLKAVSVAVCDDKDDMMFGKIKSVKGQAVKNLSMDECTFKEYVIKMQKKLSDVLHISLEMVKIYGWRDCDE